MIVWNIDQGDPMYISIWASKQDFDAGGLPTARIFLGEALESAGRGPVMKHIAEIERSPWIRSWHADYTYEMLRRP